MSAEVVLAHFFLPERGASPVEIYLRLSAPLRQAVLSNVQGDMYPDAMGGGLSSPHDSSKSEEDFCSAGK